MGLVVTDDVMLAVRWPFCIDPSIVLMMTEFWLAHRDEHERLTRDAILRRAFCTPDWGYIGPAFLE